MYCPKCGTQNIDDASFCRACGANLSLVPQALAGRLPEGRDESLPTGRKRRRDKEPRIDKAVTNVFMGVAFLLVAFMVKNYAPAGFMWWFWMLIPAFSLMGGGVAEFMRLRQANAAQQSLPETRRADYASSPPAPLPPARDAIGLPPQHVAPEAYTPASVTEHTTKLLERDR